MRGASHLGILALHACSRWDLCTSFYSLGHHCFPRAGSWSLVVAISDKPGNASSNILASWEVIAPTTAITTTTHGWQASKTISLERGH